jgi:hypothetical protein
MTYFLCFWEFCWKRLSAVIFLQGFPQLKKTALSKVMPPSQDSWNSKINQHETIKVHAKLEIVFVFWTEHPPIQPRLVLNLRA